MNRSTIQFTVAALLLLFFLTCLVIGSNSVIFGQSESMSKQMSMESIGGVSISSLTNWIGIFSTGIIVGLLAFKTNNSNDIRSLERKRIILSVAILSLSVGTIHLLLIQEHAKESFWWGVIFTISGIAQIGFGLIILFIKRRQFNTLWYYIGSIGNTLLVVTFVLVRVFTPPFSPEGTPINELEPNGIITLVMEIIIVILLTYILIFKEEVKRIMK
ncbi:MAG: DoxX-like family protein [Candidatus Nitrosocosmicus sp.]